MKMRKVFILTRQKPGVKRIAFKHLRAGNIFYTEEPDDSSLTVDEFPNGRIAFLYRAMTKAKQDKTGMLFVKSKPASARECF